MWIYREVALLHMCRQMKNWKVIRFELNALSASRIYVYNPACHRWVNIWTTFPVYFSICWGGREFLSLFLREKKSFRGVRIRNVNDVGRKKNNADVAMGQHMTLNERMWKTQNLRSEQKAECTPQQWFNVKVRRKSKSFPFVCWPIQLRPRFVFCFPKIYLISEI